MMAILKFPILVFLSWYIIILLFQLFLEPNFFQSTDLEQRIFKSWVYNWDSGHYLSIASKGYIFPQQNFFPLWPLLIKTFTLGIFSTEWVMYFLTFFLSLTTFILFYMLAAKVTSEGNAKLSLLIFASFPSAMFLHAGYTENLFLTLSLLSFWLLEKKRFILSSLIGGLVGATRSVGIVFCLLYLFVKTSFKKRIFYCFLGSLGLLGFMIYQFIAYWDPLLFTKAHQFWCAGIGQCKITFPLKPLIPYTSMVLAGWIKPNLSALFLDWVSSWLFIILLWPVFKYLKKIYFLYSLVVVLMPLATGMSTSMVRYVLVAFPVFFVLPKIIKRKYIIYFICILLLILQLRFVGLFVDKIWVA